MASTCAGSGSPFQRTMNRSVTVVALSIRRGGAEAIDAAERRVRSAVPIARVIYLEPDLLRPSKERGERAPNRNPSP